MGRILLDRYFVIISSVIIYHNLLSKKQILKNQLNSGGEKNLLCAQVSVLMDAHVILSSICQWSVFIHDEIAEDTVLVHTSLLQRHHHHHEQRKQQQQEPSLNCKVCDEVVVNAGTSNTALMPK